MRTRTRKGERNEQCTKEKAASQKIIKTLSIRMYFTFGLFVLAAVLRCSASFVTSHTFAAPGEVGDGHRKPSESVSKRR